MRLAEVIEGVPLSRIHYMLLAVSSLSYMFAAMNCVLIAPALDLVAREFALDARLIGIVVGVTYGGMLIGAVTFGALSDVLGRRLAIIVATVIHAVFTALFAFVWSFSSILALRFLAGYGLGGLLPLPGVYVSEFVPARYRGRFLGIVETSWVFGALLAAGFGLAIIPSFGWRTLFYTGLLPLATLPLLAAIPESIRYLEKRGRLEEAARVLKRFGVSASFARHEEAEKVSLGELLSKSYRARSVLLWTLWFVLVYTYHGIFIWLKAFFAETGFIPNPLFFYFVVTFAQIPGYLSATFLLDKIGRKLVLELYLCLAGLGCLMFALAQSSTSVLLASCFIGFFNLGSWAGLYAYTPELYPTRIRGTGSGVAASFGRVGGLLQGPLTGLALATFGLTGTFGKFAILHWVAALATLLFGVETKGKTLEEISE